MSLDRSLKAGGNLTQHRNILTRAEKIARLMEAGEFDMTTGNPLRLRKVANRKLATGKKAGKKEGEAAGEGAAAAGAAAPAAAAPAKGAAPAGKGAAPAAKAAPASKGGKK